MSGTTLCPVEDALRFGVVPQQVALAARQFVHSGILLRHIKKEIRLMCIQAPFALKAPVSMVRTDWGPAHLSCESGGAFTSPIQAECSAGRYDHPRRRFAAERAIATKPHSSVYA